jgi:dinuclear metal center YbgI/SA1388 family protein
MPIIGDIVNSLEQFAPTSLAEDWDNVGLLVGSPDWPANRVMTCLTVTPSTVDEAMQNRVELIVSHHPMPFQPLSSITSDSTSGRMLLELIGAKIGIYSPHTAFDSAQTGINQHLAIGLGLQQIEPLIPSSNYGDTELGAGRKGFLGEQISLLEMAERVKTFLNIQGVRVVGTDDVTISKVAIACGSGGSFLDAAIKKGCDCLVTGETNFHTCLEAEARGVGLILPGHFASEQFALLSLADYLGDQFSDIEVWASRDEHDPIRSV